MAAWIDSLKQWARRLKHEVFALYLCYRDPRVPWYARLFAGAVVAYAFSPIDLIPDFIPVLGLLDDLLLVPLGVWLALKMIPADVMAESRIRAGEALRNDRPVNRAAAFVIVGVWLVLAAISVTWLLSLIPR
jgi:uncharacterized membrane protein YkvA (DUF1232 family)